MVSMLGITLPIAVHAQTGGMGGMGGMGGGMGGMRGGGMRGGRGGPPGAGKRRSPADLARERLENANTLAFLLDHRRPLRLTRMQTDSIKRYRKDVEQLQKPLFASLDDVMRGSMPRGPRGRAPGMNDGMSDGMSDGRGDGPSGEAGTDRLFPDTARTLLRRLEDIQQSYVDRAWAQLDSTQRRRADSIQTVRLQELREKARERMERRPRD